MIYGLDQNIFSKSNIINLIYIFILGVFNLGTLIQKLVIEKFKIINSKVNIFLAQLLVFIFYYTFFI